MSDLDSIAEAQRAFEGPNGISLPGALWLVSARA
jgi:hypothetical protein